MGEETEPTTVAEGVTADEPSRDSHRKRKKLLHKSLLEMMEFYLGDANLFHDKFLNDRIQGKPFVYVDLSIFLTFNKVKALTSDIKDLAKSIKHSQFLQLSDDETQVCRITPIKKKENVDDCTIYVEQLGPDVNHDILIKVFSEFGYVDYISLPRYSHNGKFKGFAFVEFRDPECAKKALELLNAKGCCLSPHMAPEELLSVKSFDVSDKNKCNKGEIGVKDPSNKKKNKRKYPGEGAVKEVIDKDVPNNSDDQEGSHKKKKKITEEEEPQMKEIKTEIDDQEESHKKKKKTNEEEEPQIKQLKTEIDDQGDSHKKNKKTNEEEEPQMKEIKTEIQGTNTAEETPSENEDESDNNNKKRKLSSMENLPDKTKTDMEEKIDFNIEPAKKKIKSDPEALETDEESHTEEEATDNTMKQQKKRKRKKKMKKDKVTASSLGLRVLSKREWKQLRNKYLNMQREVMTSLKQQLYRPRPEAGEPKVEERFKPGTVIKVTLEEPVTNASTTKSEFRIHPEICYVDVKEGSPCVYLRTTSPDLATSVVQTKHWPNMELLQGDEEAAYWDKIKIDRQEYFQQKSKRKQRGRTKLLKRAEKFQEKQI